MNRVILLIITTCFSCTMIAQRSPAATQTSDSATVDVLVTDMKGKPSPGELIIFGAVAAGKVFTGRSAAGGKFSLKLPAGDQYIISVKSLGDSTRYGTLDIPALEAGQFFTGPFAVEVNFEPARTFTLKNVLFDVGKASLRPESFAALEELLDYLRYKEAIIIEIGEHTDNIGSDPDNLRLSQQRAEAIRNYLVKKGIQPARLLAKGYGATQPVADNATEQGRQLNRRTEIKIL